MQTERDLKEALAGALGIPLSGLRDDIWDYLCTSLKIEAALSGDYGPIPEMDLADDYRELERAFAGSVGRRSRRLDREQPRSLAEDARSRALARILVTMAERDPQVRSLRTEILADHLLEPTAVVDWIEREARGQPSVRVERIILPEGVVGYDPYASRDDAEAYATWLETVAHAAREQGLRPTESDASRYAILAYRGPSDDSVRFTPVNPGTKLARLKAVAAQLVSRYRWHEDDAVGFLLSGREPPLPIVTVSTRRGPLPALERIALEIDPRIAASEVARIYARERRDVWRVRDREMQDKHLALAVFAEAHRDSGETWPHLRERWNEAVGQPQPRWGFDAPRPDWAYEASDAFDRRFATDCRTAWSRVTGLQWQRLEAPDEEAREP